MFPSLRTFLPAAAVAVALLPAHATAGPLLTLHFGGGLATVPGHGHVDLGQVSADRSRHGRAETRVRTRISLRLESRTAFAGSARVWVVLSDAPEGARLSVDGFPIGPTPTLVTPMHRIGSDVGHDVELSLPAHVAAGPFTGNIAWTAEAN